MRARFLAADPESAVTAFLRNSARAIEARAVDHHDAPRRVAALHALLAQDDQAIAAAIFTPLSRRP